MGNLKESPRKAGSQKLGELFIEFFDLLGSHTSADSRAGSNAASPCLGRVWGLDIVGERLKATIPRLA